VPLGVVVVVVVGGFDPVLLPVPVSPELDPLLFDAGALPTVTARVPLVLLWVVAVIVTRPALCATTVARSPEAEP
jgi:hypothetical protein